MRTQRLNMGDIEAGVRRALLDLCDQQQPAAGEISFMMNLMKRSRDIVISS
jgi:hypothetical protein